MQILVVSGVRVRNTQGYMGMYGPLTSDRSEGGIAFCQQPERR